MKTILGFLFLSLFLTACSDGFLTAKPRPAAEQSLGSQDPVTDPPDLKICSDLSFEGVRWSSNLDFMDQTAFALALNISSSYEGHAGWSNLSNNFDGQGVSMGLLNQNLGTGSLQPLLYTFKNESPQNYASLLSASQKSALDSMLAAWAKAKGISSLSKTVSPRTLMKAMLIPTEESTEKVFIVNKTDSVDKIYAEVKPDFQVFGKAEEDGVAWALRTLYVPGSDRTFKDEWRTTLKNIASHPDYISLQIEAAEFLHERALGYTERLGFTELRAYLMLFDIAVQNGSLRTSHFDTFFNWRANNPSASEEQQMIQLVDIRAASSRPQFQDDVKRRKKTIVLGTGFVHGSNRNLPEEYCYDPLVKYPLTIDKP